MEPKIVKEGYVVITPTLLQGDVLAWAVEGDDGEDYPDVFNTLKEAQLELLDSLEMEIADFKQDHREWDEINFDLGEEYVARYIQYDNGKFIVYEIPEEGKPDNGSLILETTLEEWRNNR